MLSALRDIESLVGIFIEVQFGALDISAKEIRDTGNHLFLFYKIDGSVQQHCIGAETSLDSMPLINQTGMLLQ